MGGVLALMLVAASGCEAVPHDMTEPGVATAVLGCKALDRAQEAPGGDEAWRCDWAQAGRSPRRTGYNDAEDKLSPETVGSLRRLWSAPIAATGPVATRPIQPVLWQGNLFAARRSELVQLDAATGRQIWRFSPLVDVWTETPAVARGRVVAMNVDALFGIDVQTGAELWRRSPPAFDYAVAAPLVVGSLAVVVPHRLGDPATFEVLARDLATGEQVWALSGNGSTTSRRAASANGVVYASVPGGDVVALAATDGSVRWVHGVADGQVGSLSVSAGRVLVPWAHDGVPERPRAVRALDAESGQLAWRADVGCDLPLDPSPVADGRRAYVACPPHAGQTGGVQVVAIDLASGRIEFTVSVGAGGLTGELSGAGGVLFVGTDDGNVYALEAATGQVRGVLEVGAPTSQAVIADGYLFLGTPEAVLAYGLP